MIRRVVLWALPLVAALLAPHQSFAFPACAAGTTPTYNESGQGTYYPSQGAACQAAFNRLQAGTTTYTYRFDGAITQYSSSQNYCNGHKITNATGATTTQGAFIGQLCQASTCAVSPGTLKSFNGLITGTFCADNCQYSGGADFEIPGAQAQKSFARATGATCTTPSGTPTSGFPMTDGTTTIGGYSTGTQCGTVDGKTICVAALKAGECRTLSSGGGVCVYGARPVLRTSPQSPDTGVPGQVQTPTATIYDADRGRTIDYYNAGAMGGSTTQPGVSGGSGAGGNGDDNGNGTCDPGEACSDDGTGNQGEEPGADDCGNGGDCVISDLAALDEGVPTIGDSLSTFVGKVQTSPAYASFANLSWSGGGDPPSAEFEVFGETYVLTPPPEVLAAIIPVLTVIMLVVWALIAVFIIFSA